MEPTEEDLSYSESCVEPPIQENFLSDEEINFDSLLTERAKLNLGKNDTVLFQNGLIGKISNILIDKETLQYRIYVQLSENCIVILNENFKNIINDDPGYNVRKIVGSNFTNVKLQMEPKNIILTAKQAQKS